MCAIGASRRAGRPQYGAASLEALGHVVRRHVAAVTRCTCSIGVGPSTLLARYATKARAAAAAYSHSPRAPSPHP
eukprot:229371-Prymnesium_polylepis.1